MYNLVSAIAKTKNNPRKWISVDIANMLLFDIFDQHKIVKVLLSDQFMVNPEIFDLDYLKTIAVDMSLTFDEFLISNADTNLPTVPGTLDIVTNTVKYSDAFRAGYTVNTATQFNSHDTPGPKEDRRWLVLQKEDADYTSMSEHCLSIVNGFYHFSEASSQGHFIKDGAVSNRICGHNTVGLISFDGVSRLTQIPITEDMIHKQGDNPLYFRTILDVGQDISNKTVLLSIGGYLVLPSTRVFWAESGSKLTIDFNNYSLLNRFFESSKYLDFTDYPFDFPTTNGEQYINDEIHSDAFITYLMTMSQSFIIVLDNPDINFDKEAIRVSPMPGIYTSYIPPIYPLVIGQGMMANYWYTSQKPYWSINTIDGLRHRRQYNTTLTNDLLSLDDSRNPSNPVNWSMASYLMITTDVFVN